MSYGFRLYEVKFVRGVGKARAEELSKLGVDGKLHAAKQIERMFDVLRPHGVLRGSPKNRLGEDEDYDPLEYYRTAEVDRRAPGIRFEDCTLRGVTRVRFSVKYGRVGAFEDLYGDTADQDQNIVDQVAGNGFRGVFYFPVSGTHGVLALEVIDRAHPFSSLDVWLSRAGIELRAIDKKAIDEGETDPTKLEAAESVWKPGFEPITDYNRIIDLLLTGAPAEVELMRFQRAGTRKLRKKDMSLRFWSAATLNRKSIGKILDDFVTTKKITEGVAIAKLKGLLAKNVPGTFDDVAIVVEDKGRPRTIRLTELEKALVYDLGPKRLKDKRFHKEVRGRIAELGLATTMNLVLD